MEKIDNGTKNTGSVAKIKELAADFELPRLIIHGFL